MSSSYSVLARIAALRFPSSVAPCNFAVELSNVGLDDESERGRDGVVVAEFVGSGEVEMREAGLELSDVQRLCVRVVQGDQELCRLCLSLSQLQGQTDWSLLQRDDFEVRVQLLLSSRLPSGYIDSALDLLAAPRIWYLKAEDLYAVLRRAASALAAALPHGPLLDHATALVDLATEAVCQRLYPLSCKDRLQLLTALDELLSHNCIAIDASVDRSRLQLVAALGRLRDGVSATLQAQREAALQLADAALVASRQATAAAADRVTSSVADASAQTASHLGAASLAVASLSEQSRGWATSFLAAKLQAAQPFAVRATQMAMPYADLAMPYADLAMPYVLPAINTVIKYAEEAPYVGVYVSPAVDSAGALLHEAKSYCCPADTQAGLLAAAQTPPVAAGSN